MKAQLTGTDLAALDSGSQPASAEPAERTDAAAMEGDAARETELVAVPTGYGLVASDSPRSDASSADAGSVTLTDAGQAPPSSPKRRVSFAKKLAAATIEVHADGTAGTVEPPLRPDHATVSPTPANSASVAETHIAVQPNATIGEDLKLGRSGLRSGRKKAHLNFKSNSIVPMPGTPAPQHNPLYDGPPSRSVSGLTVRSIAHALCRERRRLQPAGVALQCSTC